MAFTYRLEQEDGTSADPPVLHTAVPNWQPADTIPLGADQTLRVIETRFDDPDELGVKSSSSPSADSRAAVLPRESTRLRPHLDFDADCAVRRDRDVKQIRDDVALGTARGLDMESVDERLGGSSRR